MGARPVGTAPAAPRGGTGVTARAATGTEKPMATNRHGGARVGWRCRAALTKPVPDEHADRRHSHSAPSDQTATTSLTPCTPR